MTEALTRERAEALVKEAISAECALGFTDIHTHLYWRTKSKGRNLARIGPDDAVDYHYVYGEVNSTLGLSDAEAKALWARPQRERVDWLVEQSFCGRLPLSEGTLGLLTMAKGHGIDTSSGNFKKILSEWRELYADTSEQGYLDRIFSRSEVERVVMTNSPFVAEERELLLDDAELEALDKRFLPALRLDEFIHKRDEIGEACEECGFPEAAGDPSELKTQAAMRDFTLFWLERLPGVCYAAVSLSDKTDFEDRDSVEMLVLEKVLIPVCRERGIPVVLMPFVERQIRPSYANAGDVVKKGDINGLVDFMARHLDTFFMVTPLDANDNYNLSFAARALGNFEVWGHWWCNLNPSLIGEQLRLRLENNGYCHFGINSDARILDQLLYKFTHYWRVMTKVLVDRCMDINQQSGWPITVDQIRNSIRTLQDHERLFARAKQ